MNMVSVVSSGVLAVSLAMFWGDGRALEGWGLGYIALLSYINVAAITFEAFRGRGGKKAMKKAA